jgi:hypothetical protein
MKGKYKYADHGRWQVPFDFQCFADEGEMQALRDFLEKNVKRSRLKIKAVA